MRGTTIDSRPGGSGLKAGTVLAAAFAAALLAALALGTERADGFGTINRLGQQAEHERITRMLQCGNPAPVADCVQSRTMSVLAGRDGTLGAVGQPDHPLELYAFPDAHCDGGDYFDRAGYPQTLAQANAHIQRCAFAAFARLNAAVDAAGQIVDGDGRLRVSETDIDSCGFPSQTTASTADSKTAKCQVLNQFGRSLHAIEDFWSHSNWADAAGPGTTAVDNPPGMLRSAIPEFFRYGSSGGVTSADQLQIPAGLITGCDDSFPTEALTHSSCGKPGSSGDRVKHSDLNKDRGVIDPRTGATSQPDTSRGKLGRNFAAAVTGARDHVAQTWVDLTAAIRARYPGARGAAIIGAIASDTPWTRCQLTGSSPNAQSRPVGSQSSTRSTTVRLQNRTASAFACSEAALSAGEWASVPPDEVASGGNGGFRTQTDVKRGQTSTKGAALYAIGATGYSLRVAWENPLVGSNSYDCAFLMGGQNVTSGAPFACSRSGGSGNDASPTFTITSRSRSGAPPEAPPLEREASVPREPRGEPGDGGGDSPRPDPLVLGENALGDCSGYARNFSLHVDDQTCERALNKLARSVAEDDVCPRGWHARRDVRIEDYNERSDEMPPLVMCVERDENEGDGERGRYAFQVLAH